MDDTLEKTSADILRKRFGELPFSILNTRSGEWHKAKKKWLELGIRSELGRDAKTFNIAASAGLEGYEALNDTSIFDPFLCELMYRWFCPDGGTVLDPFAGGSVRGIVASMTGHVYTGIELRPEQVDANREQAVTLVKDTAPTWLTGDSDKVLDTLTDRYDMVMSCPPYFDLEVYSKDRADLSGMTWEDFVLVYRSIIAKTVHHLKDGQFAVFVVGDVRDEEGYYRNLPGVTVQAFMDAGAPLYNEMVLMNAIATAALRANGNMETSKVVKVHQNVLVFKKRGDLSDELRKTITTGFERRHVCEDCGGKIQRGMCEDCMKKYPWHASLKPRTP